MRTIVSVASGFLLAAMSASATITGSVMNSDGQPIAGAKIESFALETIDAERARLVSSTPERKALAAADSDGRGKFTLESPKDAVVVLRVNAAGYAPAAFRVERDEEAGALILSAAETKTGRVVANGKAVAGAKVIWSGNGEAMATTDAEGRYKVPDPTKWANNVVVLHPEYAVAEESVAGSPNGGGRNENVERTVTTGTRLSGTVVAEDGKTPVGGAAIFVDGWPATSSGQDGTFTIAHAPAKWQLVAARSGSLIGTRARAGAAAALVVKLAKSASLSGSIRDMKTLTPVAGAYVTLGFPTRRNSGQRESAISDAKGNYSLSGIIPGSYQIFVTRPGYAFPPVSISLTANEKATKLMMAAQLARISGTIVDEQKRPVAAARVATQTVSRGAGPMAFMLMNRAATPAAASAPDGSFVVRADGDTDIEVTAVRKGYPEAKSSKMRLAPGERKSGIVLTIPSGVNVTGRVLDKSGKPVAGATVAATEAQGGGGGNFVRRIAMNAGRQRDDDQIKTGKDGRFAIRVKGGSYDFAFKADGFATKALRAVQIGANPEPLEVILEPGVEITGRVTRGGAGVEGVRIDLIGDGGMAGNEMTGPDGSFRLTDLSAGQFMLNAMKEEEFIQQIRPVTAPSSDITIDVPAGGRISGHVVDKTSKQPVTAFDAGISTPRGGGGMMFILPPATRHFTSDDGSFLLENVPPGQTQIVVNAPGYTSARLPNIHVEDGKSITDVEVEMDHGVRAIGHVTGPDGSPLAGVSVRLDQMGGRIMNINPMQSQTVTDANGDFAMDSLEAGDRTFVFTRGGYLTTQKSATLSGTETRVDAQLSSGTRVAGAVVTDGGAPVADASVSAQSASDSGYRSTRTDGGGNFEFEGLAPGRYTFWAAKNGYADGRLRDFDITTGAPPRIVMSSGGIIYGQVTGLTADELQHASVYAQSANGNASAPVDAAGSFRIEGAPVGTVRVSATAGAGIGGKTSSAQSVQVDTGSQVEVNITFRSNTTISGHVTRNGQAVQGAMVAFNPKNATAQTRASTSTDSNGQYEVSALDDGDYNVLVVDIQRSAPYSATYTVRGSGSFDIDMKAVALHGRVMDSEGNAVSDALVELRDKSDSGGGFRTTRAVQSDASGSFLVDNVPSGSYSVSAEKEGYGTRAVDTTVNDSGGNVEITLTKNAGVKLRVVDARDGRLLNAQVHVTNPQGVTVYDSPFFGGGSADAIKLPLDAGSYSAEIDAIGYAPQKVSIRSPSSPTIGLTPGGTIVVHSKGAALRRARLIGPDGNEYSRGRFGAAIFTVDPTPGVTILNNIAPGAYTLQILGEGNDVSATAPVTVAEGQQALVSI